VATETGPDLEPGRLAVEALMDDTCTVTRPAVKGGAVELDPTTLRPLPGSGAVGLYDGPCTISAADTTAQEGTIGAQAQTRTRYKVKLPINGSPAGIRSGDVIALTSSRRDPASVGRTYVVDEEVTGTMSVSRILLATRKQPAQ